MKTALLVPCYNEEQTIGQVIQDFKKHIPDIDIYVYDNNSTDQTVKISLEYGAIVKHEYQQGKSNVVRSMFREIEADIYIMVDGDNTYPASEAQALINTFKERNCDMVVGDRLTNGSYSAENKRALHGFGNNLVKNLINYIFNSDLKDIMTGYRVFSKRFVKNYPIMYQGFELETEMTIFALNNNLRIAEIPISFKDRPEGSFSKLNTYRDGFKVLLTIFNLFRHYKPLQFFSIFSVFFFFSALAVGAAPIIEYFKYDFVYKVPSAILASGLMLFSLISFTIGLILDTISINNKKLFQILFLK
ncbi:MAG: glycosyltransferase family 2 protein [Bacteroidales bacterium]